MSEILKEKEHNDTWQWAGTKIDTLHCYPESAQEIIEAQKESYIEQGYEVIDSFITKNHKSRMCIVNLLIKSIKK